MSIIKTITKSINNIVLVSLGTTYLIAGTLVVYFANSHMKEQALHDAADRAKLLLYRNLAEHDYFTSRLKPELFRINLGSLDNNYFDPCWMSSTYAVREMDKGLKEKIKEEYYYKEAAINARSKDNEADKYETEFLEELNHGGKNKEIREVRIINGENYFSYMIQGEIITEDCLQCHGSPGDAPKSMVKIYGDKRSFNRKTGEVISAISIRIPLDDAYAAANNFSARLSLILLAVLFAVLLVHFLIYRKLILVPIMTVKKKALEIVNSKEHLGEQIPIYYENEFGDLTKTLNWLSANMRKLLDGMEQKVRERTEKYEKANLELMNQIQYRVETEEALKLSEQQFRSVFDNSPIGIGIYLDDRLLKANRSFTEMFGYEEGTEIEKVSMNSLLSGIEPEHSYLKNPALNSGISDNNFYELNGIKRDHSVFPVNAGFARINLPEGSAVVALISDRTELKNREEEVRNSLKEKETLLKEIHHRVKNNLQIISSLLNLQMQFIEDEKLRLLFNDSCSRVRSMSLIHEKLYQTKSLSKINIREYVLDLISFLKSAYSKDSQRIEIRTALEEVLLTVDFAVPIGLIINELVSNSMKYAFKDLQEGIIEISLIKNKEKIEITIRDNGVGMPEDVKLDNPSTLGLQLVSGLAEQIKGTIEIVREKGTKFIVVFLVG